MTLDEFITALGETTTTLQWAVTADGLRAMPKHSLDYCMCPLTAVCWAVLRNEHDFDDYEVAADELGIDPLLVQRIVRAADRTMNSQFNGIPAEKDLGLRLCAALNLEGKELWPQ